MIFNTRQCLYMPALRERTPLHIVHLAVCKGYSRITHTSSRVMIYARSSWTIPPVKCNLTILLFIFVHVGVFWFFQGRIKLFGAPRRWKHFRPLFKAVFLSGGGITPQTESNTTPPSPKTEITNILFYILNFASIIKFKM